MRFPWIFFFLLVTSLVTGLPGDASKVWAEASGAQIEKDVRTGSPGSNFGTWLLGIYRDNISPVDGDRCPSTPSCSAYSVQAIKKHGFFIGWMMTVDRLIHEGKEEARVSPVVQSRGQWKIFDPVENNDYWWHASDRNDHD
jgi:hypothetical protein